MSVCVPRTQAPPLGGLQKTNHLSECLSVVLTLTSLTKLCSLRQSGGVAQVAEVVDALDSGSSGQKAVEVRFFSWAPSVSDGLLSIRKGKGFIGFAGSCMWEVKV